MNRLDEFIQRELTERRARQEKEQKPFMDAMENMIQVNKKRLANDKLRKVYADQWTEMGFATDTKDVNLDTAPMIGRDYTNKYDTIQKAKGLNLMEKFETNNPNHLSQFDYAKNELMGATKATNKLAKKEGNPSLIGPWI